MRENVREQGQDRAGIFDAPRGITMCSVPVSPTQNNGAQILGCTHFGNGDVMGSGSRSGWRWV